MSMIHEKIIAAMKDIEAIGKNSKNVQQNFKFRGIDDVYNSLHPILSKHELFTVPKVLEDKTEERQTKLGGTLIYRMLKIEYTVFTSDGSCVSATVMGEGMDSGDKAASKAMSIAHKYFLMQLFCIPTADATDPDAESHAVMSTVAECKATLETAKNLESLKQAYKYCLPKMIERNISQEEMKKFEQYASQLSDKFKNPNFTVDKQMGIPKDRLKHQKEETTNETN